MERLNGKEETGRIMDKASSLKTYSNEELVDAGIDTYDMLSGYAQDTIMEGKVREWEKTIHGYKSKLDSGKGLSALERESLLQIAGRGLVYLKG